MFRERFLASAYEALGPNRRLVLLFALAFSKDGKMLAAGYADGKIRVWRPSNLTLLAEIEAHKGKVTGLAFSADGTQLVSGGDDKIAKLWAVTK